MAGYYVELTKPAYYASEIEAPDMVTAIAEVKAMAGGYDEWQVVKAQKITRQGETASKDLDAVS